MCIQSGRARYKPKPDKHWLLGLLLIIFLILSWPPGVLFFACLQGWFWARSQKKGWSESIARVLLPLAVGFGADSLLAVFLRIFRPDLNPHHWRFAEEVVVCLRIKVHSVANIGFLYLLLIVLALLALNYFLPQWKAFSRFAMVQQVATTVFLMLAAMTTFTLFADRPLEQAGERDRSTAAERVDLAFRTE